MSAKPTEYASGQLWFSRDGEHVSLGITEAALGELGSVESIEFAELGDEFSEGDRVAEVVGTNASMDVVAPVAFLVTERNDEVGQEPRSLEDDPTGDGWILRGRVLEQG